MLVNSKNESQIEGLLFDETSTKILVKYFNYSNNFLVDNIAKLSELAEMNDYTIKLEDDKQPSFRPI